MSTTNHQCQLALIVAMNKQRIIGINNALPWHIKEDLQYFKKCTLGKTVIMGRQTYLSIGKALPNRLNIILTKNIRWGMPQTHADNCGATEIMIANSWQEAIELANKRILPTCSINANAHANNEVFIIGGGKVFEDVLAANAGGLRGVSRLYITEVDMPLTPNKEDVVTYFPEIDWNNWCLISKTSIITTQQLECSFLCYHNKLKCQEYQNL